MTQPNFTLTPKIMNLAVSITEMVTRLELEKERSLHLRKESKIQTIYSSLAIENNSLSLDQVTDVINGKKVLGRPQDIHEVQNAYETYEAAFKLNPYSVEDFLLAHRLLMKGLVKEAGQFRSGDVGVFDESGQPVHIGARPQFVPQLVEELFSWAQEADIPDLIKACLVHFELEIIHPFSDGNGRMGRLWQNLLLSRWQSIFEWIPIETMVYQHQQTYYDTLAQANIENDAAPFIEFMLDAISQTIKDYL